MIPGGAVLGRAGRFLPEVMTCVRLAAHVQSLVSRDAGSTGSGHLLEVGFMDCVMPGTHWSEQLQDDVPQIAAKKMYLLQRLISSMRGSIQWTVRYTDDQRYHSLT